jgi:hypothetical protein
LAADDISAIAAYKRSRMGLMWSNQSNSTFYFAYHQDGPVRGSWAGGPAYSAPNVADDHINLKQLVGSPQGLYAAVKTSLDATGSQDAPQNLLLALNLSSDNWSATTFGTVDDCHTRPMIVIDSKNSVVHMFATAPSTGSGCPGSGTPGTIYEKTTSAINPSFPDGGRGRGTPVIRDAASANMNNVTGTKQNVTPATGLVVLASNDDTHQYWHAEIPLSGTAPTVRFAASTTSGPAPLAVTFTDTSTGKLTGWSWNFGDGTTSTEQEPTHTYTTAGTFNVTLTRTAANGPNTSSPRTIQVNPAATGT